MHVQRSASLRWLLGGAGCQHKTNSLTWHGPSELAKLSGPCGSQFVYPSIPACCIHAHIAKHPATIFR